MLSSQPLLDAAAISGWLCGVIDVQMTRCKTSEQAHMLGPCPTSSMSEIGSEPGHARTPCVTEKVGNTRWARSGGRRRRPEVRQAWR